MTSDRNLDWKHLGKKSKLLPWASEAACKTMKPSFGCDANLFEPLPNGTLCLCLGLALGGRS